MKNAMTPYLLVSFVFVYFYAANCLALEPKHSSTSPSIDIPKSMAQDIYGLGVHKPVLTCHAVVNNMLQNQGQATPICNDAVLSCLRHGLIQQMVHAQSQDKKTGFNLVQLKEALDVSTKVTQYRLVGCAVAIAMSGASAVSTSLDELTYFGP